MKLYKFFNYVVTCFLFPMIIFMVMHYGIKEIMNIHIATDEFGYWTAAANIVGYDWSQCASWNDYYSFGYGIILAPLLFLKNPNLIYKVALYINIVFVVISYFEIRRIIQNLFIDKKYICSFISLSVNLYAGLVFYTKLTLVECLLWCCFCTSTLLLQEYGLREKNIYFVLACLVNVFMSWVHMRTIGIIIALLCSFIIYCICSKKSVIKYFWIFIILGIGIIFLVYFKKVLKLQQYSNSVYSANDMISQIGKIKMLITYNGVKRLFLNVIGRIWYLGNSTFLMFYFGFFFLVREIIEAVRTKNKYILLYIYVFLSFIFAIGISAIYMLEIQDGRRDILFYGRYSENTIAPILAFGILEIFLHKNLFKKFLGASVFQLLGAVIVERTVIDFNMSSCLDFSIPGFYYWIKKENFSDTAYLSASLLIVLIVIICIFIYNILRKDSKIILVCVVFSVLSVMLGYKSYEISDTHDHDEDYFEVYTSIENNLKEKKGKLFYCYNEADTTNKYFFMGVDRLQFLMKDQIIDFCNLSTENLTYDMTIITRPNSEADKYLNSFCTLILENKEFNIYEYK